MLRGIGVLTWRPGKSRTMLRRRSLGRGGGNEEVIPSTKTLNQGSERLYDCGTVTTGPAIQIRQPRSKWQPRSIIETNQEQEQRSLIPAQPRKLKMDLRPSASHHLITLSGNGDLQELSTALQWPSFAQIALQTESVLFDARVGSMFPELNLHRMLCAAARSGHADIVQLLLSFGQMHNLTAKDTITMDTMDAALQEKPLEVLLNFKAVDPGVFHHPLHMGSHILYIACRGGPSRDDAPRRRWLNFVKHLVEVEGRDVNTPAGRREGMFMSGW